MDGEKCDKCGEIGEDRRTLWMACFYAMNELNIPFNSAIINSIDKEAVISTDQEIQYKSIKFIGNGKTTETNGTAKIKKLSTIAGQDVQERPFYTLRVCKSCRADWMQAIEHWFNDNDFQDKPRSTGTGVFIRDHGINRELTEDEIKERWPIHGD